MTVLNANEIGYYDLNKKIVECDDNDITITDAMGQRYIGCGVAGKTITVEGTPGNALGAYLDGSTIIVHGNGQDAIGDTMNNGEIFIHGNCGDTTGYAMRSGKIFVKGNAGYRVGIHMKEYHEFYPKIIIGGEVGDFLGEYQAGGIIIVLGIGCDGKAPIGSFCGTGMHGGHMYIRSDEAPKGLPVQVSCEVADDSDKADIREYVDEFAKNFGYNTNELLKGRFYKLSPNTASPYKQLYTHN